MTSKILKMCFLVEDQSKAMFRQLVDDFSTSCQLLFDEFSTTFRRLFDDLSTTLRRVFDGSSTKRRDGKNEKGYHGIPPNLPLHCPNPKVNCT